MLEIRNLSVSYGKHSALQEVSLNVSLCEIVVILGANGAGKSTLLRAISGVCEGQVTGVVKLGSTSINQLSSDQIVECGIALVPEGRGIFSDLTVKENLLLGAYSNRARRDENANLVPVLKLFPKLRERQGQIVRTMSGGEQQMVAIGRAMMSAPQILLLDEPSLGLSPILCKELFENLATVKKLGIGILLVEQNAKQSLAIADRGYLLENTRITHEDTAAQLTNDPSVQKAYLGVGNDNPRAVSVDEIPLELKFNQDNLLVEVRPQPRRSASQQTGLDIDDLVDDASVISAGSVAAVEPPSFVKEEVESASASRIHAVVEEIEIAAKNARTNAIETGKKLAEVTKLPSTGTETTAFEDRKLPVIEIYRRPRVQVFHRRDGDFEGE